MRNGMITILDIAKHRGVHIDVDGCIAASEFSRVGLPFFGGCQDCGATIAAYNAHPGRNGLLFGSCCAEPGEIYESIETFEQSNPFRPITLADGEI